ncbi:MAG: MATE family efflux transporter [Eubacteriales bacterium]|nr:MATE family efflux transporter [Eubacteriales bacterium]
MPEQMQTNNTITQGALYQAFVKYFIPILLGSLIQQSYSFVDALIIGNFAGKAALAAIDAPYAYIKLLINAFIALSTGGTIIVSQYCGAKNKSALEETVSSMMRFSITGGVIISLIGIFFAPSFISAMLIPDDIYALSLAYLRVYFAGTIFVFSFNIASGILRALGDSKNPFYYLMFSSVLNIILDFIFVAALKWSVAGAALATIIAQATAMCLVLRKVIKMGFSLRRSKDFLALKKMLKLGSPMALQSILFSVANMFMQRGINSFGTDSIAGWSICGKSDFIIWSLADTLGLAVTTFVAQNYGAKNRERMHKSVRAGLLTSVICIGAISLILYLFIGSIASLFTRDQAAIDHAVYLMRLTCPFYLLYAFAGVFSGGIKGRGNTLHPMLITLVGTCGFRIAWVHLISRYSMSLKNIILGYPLSWGITALLFGIYYAILVYSRKNQEATLLSS